MKYLGGFRGVGRTEGGRGILTLGSSPQSGIYREVTWIGVWHAIKGSLSYFVWGENTRVATGKKRMFQDNLGDFWVILEVWSF